MKFAPLDPSIDQPSLPRLPSWAGTGRAETLEDAAFVSGAALAGLQMALAHAAIPQALLRDRLALHATEVCIGFSGRSERAGDLRDAVHLLRPGDLPGPAGEAYLSWRRAVGQPVSLAALRRALPTYAPDQIAAWLDAGQGAPVPRATATLAAVLTEAPRADLAALILADAVLAQALGWEYLTPLLAVGLQRRDLRMRGDDLRLACHRAVTAAAVDILPMATDLARKVARLYAVAPNLRAKGAEAAVAMFLTCDAVAPSALPLPDRAARRLCDRLVDLGAVRELTGRDTFRLYGV